MSIELIQEKFSAFDELPIPFCVIQMVFDLHGESSSFLFRYCNKMMEELEQSPLSMILNRSFYDLFENPDEKWLIKFGDIAKNGGRKIFRGYKDRLGKYVYIICYQALPGFCGCLLVREDWKEMLGGIYIDSAEHRL